MRWLADADVTWAVMDTSGRVPRTLATSGGYVNPNYMRQQALCGHGMPYWYTGVRIFRELITRKLEGQARNIEYVLGLADVSKAIRAEIPNVQVARSIETIMGHEGNAADAYWEAWQGLPVKWRAPVPRQPHWLAFPSRRTLRRSWETNRGATDPVNAMLNYGYYCAETQCTLACYAHALAPNLGIGHVVRDSRESFALDLIEVMRPLVDEVVLGILSEPLNPRWFMEDKDGTVRLRAPLTHRIYAEVYTQAIEIAKALLPVLQLLDGARGRRKVRND
jgi:CRISPR-associated endonuclease Cas1